ncbi:MAG: tryptophan synthase subunit alpha [Patescibacteria group bacterium]|nr:tryptophan synthase subunit alpha [Patescibacteria group bacterium]
MNKINLQLEKIKRENRVGIMAHIVCGYPNLDESRKFIKLMADCGVDFIELQIPFSDPMADGPTIMQANQSALNNGIKVKDCFDLMKKMSREVEIPLIFMGYYNTVFNYGVEKFCENARKAGCSGLIFPDIPLEEENSEHFIKYVEENNLILIRVLSPASTIERIKKNVKTADGFLYFVGRKGTTGQKSALDENLSANLKKIKKYFKIPIAVGFGISEKKHIQTLKGEAEIAVIGSAVLNTYNSAPKRQKFKTVKNFLINITTMSS